MGPQPTEKPVVELTIPTPQEPRSRSVCFVASHAPILSRALGSLTQALAAFSRNRSARRWNSKSKLWRLSWHGLKRGLKPRMTLRYPTFCNTGTFSFGVTFGYFFEVLSRS